MLKIRIIIAILFFCGSASAQGVYTPATPTIYGEQQLRYKPVIVQHLPMKDELTVNTNDTTAQLFILKSDLSLWQYTFTGGFVKVTGSSGGGGGGGEPLIIDVVGPYLEAVDDHTLNAKGWGIQNVLDTGSGLNKNATIDAGNHTFSINSASQIHFNSFDLDAGGIASGLNLQSNDVNVSQSDNAFSSKLSFPSATNLQGNHYIPMSVGGVFADETGNIPGGGGGAEGLQDVTDINPVTTAVIQTGGYNVYSDPTTQVAALASGLNFGLVDGVLTLKSTNTNLAVIRPPVALPGTVSLTLPSSSGTFALLSDIPSPTVTNAIKGESYTGSTSSTITLAHAYTTGTISLYKNGVRIPGFTEATSTTLTLTDARVSADVFLIDYNY